jgi:hypothetical protein
MERPPVPGGPLGREIRDTVTRRKGMAEIFWHSKGTIANKGKNLSDSVV